MEPFMPILILGNKEVLLDTKAAAMKLHHWECLLRNVLLLFKCACIPALSSRHFINKVYCMLTIIISEIK
jgi:hypothetical protein